MGGKKKKNKSEPDHDDDDERSALEAELLGGEKPKPLGEDGLPGADTIKDDQAKSKAGTVNGTGAACAVEGKAELKLSAGETTGKLSKKAKKKKKKSTMEEEELEEELRKIEEEVTKQPGADAPPVKKQTVETEVRLESKAETTASGDSHGVSSVTGDKPCDDGEAREGGDASEAREGGDAGAETAKDKKKKKKAKKGKEEEKKPSKKPVKGVPVAMIKKLQAAREEEERLRQEELLRQQREEEERERKRLEKLRLEEERKERLKQKEREKKLRRKKEGKPVTKKEKEAEARRQAQLAALREQGIEVPDKTQASEKKKVAYGSRQRNKKPKNQSDAAEEQTADSTEVPLQLAESADKLSEESAELAQTAEDDDDIVDNWEDQLADSDSSNEISEEREAKEVRKSRVEETESEDETSDDSTSSEESEEEPESSDLSPYEKAKKRIEARRAKHAASCSEDSLRSPVVCVLGHVDTGKTKILDKIRKSHVQDGEAGGITQQIGATFVPLESIREQTKMLKEFSKVEVKLPGLLIIDTPGHESFSNLRTRGSSLCDIAILVVDLMHGLEPQTLESISILLKGKTPFIVALNKIDRLLDWQRSPTSGVREALKRQKPNTRDQFDERVKLAVRQFAEQELNVALFWEKVDFTEYIPMVPTSAITGDGMGDLIALVVKYSQKLLSKQLMLSREVEAVVMEVKVISGLGTTVDVILRNGELKEGDTVILTGLDGPFVTTIRALLMPQPLRELRVKNAYLTPSRVCAAQGVKITARGDLDKTVAGTPLFVAYQQDEVEVLKEEASQTMKSALSAIKLQERGVYVQASTLGSLEALLEFLKQSKIPYCGVNIGPVHKRDVMKASVMLEHNSQWAVILAFDIKVERDAQEMADGLGVKIFTADIIYHLFDAFLKHRQEYRDQKRREFESVAVFPCKLRILPNCVFNTRDPIVVGVVVEAGVVKAGTPLTVPSKNFTDIGVVSSLEVNHKTVDMARQGTEVCIRVEATGDAPRLYGRHFDHTDLLVSKISRESIDAVKNYFREDMHASDWQLIIELKKTFGVL